MYVSVLIFSFDQMKVLLVTVSTDAAESLNSLSAVLLFIFIAAVVVGVYVHFISFLSAVHVAVVAQHPCAKLPSHCDDCSINPGPHAGLLRAAYCSLSRCLIAELCIASSSRFVLAERRSLWRLLEGTIYLS